MRSDKDALLSGRPSVDGADAVKYGLKTRGFHLA